MGMVYKKAKLDMSGGGSTAVQTLAGISCSLYPAAKAASSNSKEDGFKAHLKKLNKNFGLSLNMYTESEHVPKQAPTEGNFKVACNFDFFFCPNNENH